MIYMMVGKLLEIDLTSWIRQGLPNRGNLEGSEGTKSIAKNSRGIPETAEKVRLAIKRQQLDRNMKKIEEK